MSKVIQPAVLVKELHKTFRLPLDNHSGIKQLFVNFARRKKGYSTQKVLNDISFDIQKGDFFGIVGRNGSGKSTLLKILAGIYTPDRGLVQVNGSLTPFIELGVGFNPELTGYENVFLNGALLGFSRKEMEAMYDDIVSFAELENFMDQKLKNYSSGMQVRLAFSIAIRAQSDILLLDEVLAVGDEAFQRKCYEYFRRLRDEKRTVILVTHDMDAVKKYCTRAMLIDKSEVILIGSPSDVADEYSLRQIKGTVNGSDQSLHVRDIDLQDTSGGSRLNKTDSFDMMLRFHSDVDNYFVAYTLKRDGIALSESSSQYDKTLSLGVGVQEIAITIDASNLTSGEYEIDLGFYSKDTSELIAYKNAAFTQRLSRDTPRYSGIIVAESRWSSAKK